MGFVDTNLNVLLLTLYDGSGEKVDPFVQVCFLDFSILLDNILSVVFF